MVLEWSSEVENQLATEELLNIEEASASYFQSLLISESHSAFQTPNTVLETTVAVQSQSNDGNFMTVESIINVVHIGDQGIVDLAALLMFLTNKNTTDSSFSVLDSLLDMDAPLTLVSFTNGDGSIVLTNLGSSNEDAGLRRTSSERTLIVVSTVLSFCLFGMSVILIWIAGGWIALRKQVKILLHREEELTRMTKQNERDLRLNPTASREADEEDGILGVNPKYGKPGKGRSTYDGLGIKITPRASDGGSDIFSPLSEYSDTGRMPIGITSMRKLIPSRNSEKKKKVGQKKLDY